MFAGVGAAKGAEGFEDFLDFGEVVVAGFAEVARDFGWGDGSGGRVEEGFDRFGAVGEGFGPGKLREF